MQQQKLDEQQRSDPETSLHKQKMPNNVPDRAGFFKDPSTVQSSCCKKEFILCRRFLVFNDILYLHGIISSYMRQQFFLCTKRNS
jgi:hypothetical protein